MRGILRYLWSGSARYFFVIPSFFVKNTEKGHMYTVEQAKEHLHAWLEADLAVSKGQSYKIGDRSLTRADASLIMRQIKFWRDEIDRLSPETAYPRSRAYRVIPYD